MHVYRADRPGARGGGLLTAVRSNFQSYRFQLPTSTLDEIEALGVKVYFNKEWLTIVNVYIPTGIFPRDWFDSLMNILRAPFLIVGDFNINIMHARPPIPIQVRTLLDWASLQSLVFLNLHTPTRYSCSHPASLLDLTIVSPCLFRKTSLTVHPDLFDSDHHPLFLSIGFSSFTLPRPPSPSAIHWSRAGATLNSLLGPSPFTYSSFEDSCHVAVQKNSFPVPPPSSRNPPWWNSVCWKLLGLKRKHLRLARSLCSKDHWRIYKRYSAKLRRYIKTASRAYWDSLCRSTCSNGRIFKILKRLENRDAARGDNVLFHPDPIALTSSQASLFLEAFTQNDSNESLPFDLSGGDSFLDSPFSLEELSSAIQNTHASAPGPDNISANLLKHLSHGTLVHLLSIFNGFFQTGSVPLTWKLATVVPIPKPGKPPSLVSSFRPIALTSVCAKVFERMLLARLVRWTGTRQLLHPMHFGFLPFRDSTRALCTFYYDTASARNSRQIAAAVCLDIKAAYDSVWLDGLIYKLARHGITGLMGLWISRFLTE